MSDPFDGAATRCSNIAALACRAKPITPGTVAASSRLIAAFRALETQEGPHALLHDALAQHLAGPAALQEVSAALKFQATRFAFRARWFDDGIVDGLQQNASASPLKQVVLLGAGMDSRAWRLPHMQHVAWFELDRPGVLQAKRRMLRHAGAQVGKVWTPQGEAVDEHDGKEEAYRFVPSVEHDLTAPEGAWLHTLQAAGWDPTAPTLWAAEGLLLYLEQADADAVLEAVTRHSHLGSMWVVQLLTLDSIAEFQKSTFEDNALVKEFRSGVPRDASPYFSSLGWDVVKELGYVGIAAPYLDTPGMQANLAMASQLDVNEADLDAYFRFFVLRRQK